MNEKITLNLAEMKIADWIARARHQSSRKAGVVDRNHSGEESVRINYIGFVGEMAFAKAVNAYPDFTIHPRSGGFDVIDHIGNRIDVKTSDHDRRLTVEKKKEDDRGSIDLFVKCLIVEEAEDRVEVEILGWASFDDVIDRGAIEPGRDGKEMFVIQAVDLRAWTGRPYDLIPGAP